MPKRYKNGKKKMNKCMERKKMEECYTKLNK